MGVRTLCHGLAAVHFWFGCYYDWNYVQIPTEVHRMGDSFGKSGKLKFLTYWDALLQALFFTICVINDLVGTNEEAPKKAPLIRRVKDLILPCLAFPLSMFVGLTFWGIYFVDRELIFPRALDQFFPAWLNHVMHTNIMIFILIELFTSYRKYPARKVGLTILSLFMLVYLVWIHIIHAYSGMWVYPILEVLNLPLRIVFFIGLLGLSVSLYIVGEKLNGIVWSQKKHSLKKRSN
ncbi:androgen-induced gene 1 protein isoform X1 [Tribolium castaneum]|uniref:Androgen-induced gene 1 protein-like Protein n=1 Tax=Tribolium castaneum TaxID=7070 RepID=D6WWA7_TRICA|nr:PREDICTED: androgen-induced gene 1 protein isoform X1 [Tribolium castaneum]EFA08684.2 Androgen-induced gene 1 protein-like Protein [Tribolium castaneum]|eukprot:XP_966863.1 PREDICTED: androgen-induced gene 1 protein isoform X1 [Tribolium castaneum]